MKRITLLFAALVWVAIGSPAIADSFENGIAAYKRGDHAEAARLFRLAAEQGSISALHNLGMLYVRGNGVPQDYAEALRWFRPAAEQGHAGSQTLLGSFYYEGTVVPQDYTLAHMSFNLAAAAGEEHAVESREILASLMTPAQIAEAQRMAREWQPK